MGLNVTELIKPSILTYRGGVRPAALETTPRPTDAAAGTQTYEAKQRVEASDGQGAGQQRTTILYEIA